MTREKITLLVMENVVWAEKRTADGRSRKCLQ